MVIGMRDSIPAKDTIEILIDTSNVVEQFIREYSSSVLQDQDELRRACEGSITDIGLRILPFFLRISCQEAGISFDSILPVAAGVEMLKQSALNIDDILDMSSLRNNQTTSYARYGTNKSITIGTIMSSLGFRLIANGLEKNKILQNKIEVIQLFLRTYTDIYIGQFLDLQYEGDETVTEEQYFDMISKTTAYFIQAPLVAGAMLWDADSEIIKILEYAGQFLGMAYQIRDDVIDVIGDSECSGKPVGGDVRHCKMRLPVVQALQELAGEKKQKLIDILKTKNLSDESVNEAIGLINETNAIEYCISKTKEYCDQAINAMGKLSEDFESMKIHFNVVANMISSFEDGT